MQKTLEELTSELASLTHNFICENNISIHEAGYTNQQYFDEVVLPMTASRVETFSKRMKEYHDKNN